MFLPLFTITFHFREIKALSGFKRQSPFCLSPSLEDIVASAILFCGTFIFGTDHYKRPQGHPVASAPPTPSPQQKKGTFKNLRKSVWLKIAKKSCRKYVWFWKSCSKLLFYKKNCSQSYKFYLKLPQKCWDTYPLFPSVAPKFMSSSPSTLLNVVYR